MRAREAGSRPPALGESCGRVLTGAWQPMAYGLPKSEGPAWRKIERSGDINERFVFGQARVESPDYQEAARVLIERHRREGTKVTFGEGVELIKRYQPFEPDRRVPQDPTNPTKQFPNNLRGRVIEKLNLSPRAAKLVRFWTAVDTIVDTEFKADALIERAGASEREPSSYVRLDASLYQGETSETEEDRRDRVIIPEVPDVHEEPQRYRKFVDTIASEVAAKFLAQETQPAK